ncbi:ribosome maturation factor RimM [Thermoanaerobacterium thermosaccharolyticum]|jgi:16S rRNA processing protein RimM|uniref:Ribosome maturation factor RimM n=2 Tax=Thermoanaerobacterium thermosaccharolyticum TaxID=1517 RepID=A0A231VHA6_THETR|nr:ribosome maturation factor RimM [Thermoanaerobacterium thermosaccharolyticum]TCW38709.1 16S rRNA processing protein RimM [Thermohydrogenium kirishiense]AGB19078.1 16S rRNA processing protein RimM [Thermoanaerobacterium thermosaccharolyticum M0795]AST58973.1 16S rRNA processing protein [Thermoanaerobacterium thermosaccharolyticum]KAA5807792.1 16S rRNA processing protein RimM [Thermoanaerobacterium thermosaccharolyticum]MBE0069800.1 16S rRNA processing protein RimM [Thermoanaerobacterium ther
MDDYLSVGKITSAYGVNGEVKVFPLTDHLDRFYDLDYVYIFEETGKTSLNVETVRFIKNLVIVKFKEINDRNEAEKLKGKLIKITRDNAVKLDDDEYFIKDLLNMKVYTDDQKELGILKDVLKTGANDVYVVKTDERDILIPAIKDVIKKVDIKERKMTVHLLEGL